MKKLLNVIIDILILLLFVLSAAVAIYIKKYYVAPWHLIATYWITLAVKNGLDCVNKGVK